MISHCAPLYQPLQDQSRVTMGTARVVSVVVAAMVWWSLTRAAPVATDLPLCVVLPSPPSSLVQLPANVTVRPDATDWRLDFTVSGKEGSGSPPPLCVTMEVKDTRLRMTHFTGSCEDRNRNDFQLWQKELVDLQRWSTFRVSVEQDGTLGLRLEQGDVTPLLYQAGTLPNPALLQVTLTHQVQAAVGCRVSCPAHRGDSGAPGRQVTVKKLPLQREKFYFKQGRDFIKLNFELACRTTLGTIIQLASTDLTKADIMELSPLRQWHILHLEHDPHRGVLTVTLDHRTARTVPATSCNTFNKHLVRVAGEAFLSFDCDPDSGEAETLAEASNSECQCECERPMTLPAWVVAVMTLLSIIEIALVVGYMNFCLRCRMGNEKGKTNGAQLLR